MKIIIKENAIIEQTDKKITAYEIHCMPYTQGKVATDPSSQNNTTKGSKTKAALAGPNKESATGHGKGATVSMQILFMRRLY